MRIFRFLLAAVVTGALIWFLKTPQKAGDKSLPPLGAFFNPFSGFWANAERADGANFDDKSLPGLKAPCQVLYDDLLVPHIFAENLDDALRVEGFVIASQRLWQMDITTRKASGRLSEVLGARTLPIDKMTRRRGMVYAAENALVGWKKSEEGMRLLQAYTDGVNAYIDQLDPAEYPIEFKLLDYKPEHWSVLKTALVIESMAETLASGESDLASTNALALFGQETFDFLYPEWNPKQEPIIPDTGQWKVAQKALAEAESGKKLSVAPDFVPNSGTLASNELPDIDPYMKGSNNWAVSGGKTKSGHPMLANDPHLNLTLPSIWFQVQIHTPEQNCYGVALPGVPGVVIGFNEYTAWGMTNVGQDVSDWYRVKWANAERSKYLIDGQQRDVRMQVEVIPVRGQDTVYDTVRYTDWGPMVYDNEAQHPLYDCALRWISHDVPEPDEMALFLRLNSGKNFQDYQKALSGFDCPAQNFVFATRSGDIAIQVQGRYPVRAKEQGRFIQDGSTMATAWKNFIPQDMIPGMRNPSRGFVFSANQHSTPPSYPYYYLANDFEDYRSRRIYSRLDTMHDATPAYMKAMQNDNFSQRAADALPAMFRLLDQDKLDEDGRKMAKELAEWQYTYDADLTAPPLYDIWYDSCYLKTWDEMDVLRKQNKTILMPEAWRFIELLEQDTSNIFFDKRNTPQRETARDIVNESFRAMQAYFRQNPDKRTSWGPFRGFALKHLAQIDAFSRLDLVVGGNKSTPNAISKTNGPSWRMIVDLGDQVKGMGVYPGGQSGNPGSRFYDNMVNTWAKGEYYDLLFMKSAEEAPERILAKQSFTSK